MSEGFLCSPITRAGERESQTFQCTHGRNPPSSRSLVNLERFQDRKQICRTGNMIALAVALKQSSLQETLCSVAKCEGVTKGIDDVVDVDLFLQSRGSDEGIEWKQRQLS